MNTPVKPAAGQAGTDADDVDLEAGVPLATRAMAGDAQAANELAFRPRILASWLERELQGQDGLTDEERARLEQEKLREREEALVRMLEEDRERNNAIIADLRAKDADLCAQIQDMDKNAVTMPDGRLAYKDKNGVFRYLDGSPVDNQDFARQKDAENGGKTQGFEERRSAEDRHIEYNNEIARREASNAEITRIEKQLHSQSLSVSEREALQVHEDVVKAHVAKDTVLEVNGEQSANLAALAAVTTDVSHDQISRHHRPSATTHADAQPDVQSAQTFAVADKHVYLDKEGKFVDANGAAISSDVAELSQADVSAQVSASASRTSYSGGLETSQNISSKGAFTVASLGVTPTDTPDGPTTAGNALQKNIAPSPTAAV
ncbi:MAG TPA: hypothetical protein VL625_12930 [Patescibacteria group bacterium]|nr:hypothetical protein [Patescibacteria group bacterium]